MCSLSRNITRAVIASALFLLAWGAGLTRSEAQVATSGTGVVRHAVSLTGSNRVEGSLQILTGETSSFGGTAVVTGDLLVPGTPTVQFGGNPIYGGTLQGTGSTQPSNYAVAGDGHFSLRHVVVRSNPVLLPVVAAPPLPAGTRDVTLSRAGDNAGSFFTIRNLTVDGAAGDVVVPPGTYGSFSVNGRNSLTLGVAGATQAAVYNFQRLEFSGNDDLRFVGPVIITVNGSVTCGGRIGSSPNPGWLKLRLATGDLVLSGNNTIYGEVVVPNGLVRFNGNSELIGGLACNQLVLNGNNLLRFLVLNSPPAASNQLVTTNEDTSAAILLHGTDPDNNPLTYTLLSAPAHGTLSGAAPSFSYTPNLNYHGSDSFTFKVGDGQADSNVATVSIAVTAVNDPPTANAQALTTEEDNAIPVTLSGQDVDGDALTYRILSGPAHGSIGGTPPQLTYTPAHDFNGTDQLTFAANDGTVDSAIVAISIAIGPINDAPIAIDSSVETEEDTELQLILEATDPDGNALTYRVSGAPQHGILSGNPPNLTYTPAPNYAGPDSFTFRASDNLDDSALATVFINVRQVNDPPTAAEQNVSTTEDTARPITLAGSDVEGDPLGFRIEGFPAHGTLSGTPPDITYTPALNYNGSDSFTFRTNDHFEESEAATVTITIAPANDAPVAMAQELNTTEDTELGVTLRASDIEEDHLSYTILQSPQHGALSGNAPNLTYTPAANYSGPDSFIFRANDGQADSNEALVQITIRAANDSPVADNQSVTTDEDSSRDVTLTGSDVDADALSFRIISGPSHGELGGAAPQFTYTPASNYNGPDAFSFVANDGTVDSAPATVSISVGPINDAPVTYNQEIATNEDSPRGVLLWADEYDGDPVTFTISSLPQHGTISGVSPDLVYTPAPDYHGLDSFAFKANDGQEDSNVSLVTIVIRPVNDAPTAAGQTRITPEDSPLEIALTAADVDGDPLSYTVLTPPAHGLLSGTPPNFTYSPAPNFNGDDAFVFQANDGSLDSAPATISITVQPVNDLPVAVPENLSTDEELPLQVLLKGNDVDGDTLTFLVVTPPEHGTLSGTPPELVYTPSPNYNGPDRIVFAINDGTDESLPAEVQITVRPVNDAPAAQGQSISTAEDTALPVVLAGTDADGDALSYVIVAQPQHGSLSGTPPDVTYRPAADYDGSDTFAFKVNDGTADSPEASVHIAITAVNDAPTATAQTVITDQNTAASVTLGGSDIDQDTLSFSILTAPAHGAISGAAPNFTYTPAENYHGPDSFTFRVNDGATDSSPATVSITVNRINRRPLASDQLLTTEEDTPKVVVLSGTDPDGDPLTYLVTSNPAHGRLLGSGTTLTYRPNANFAGADSFSFKVNDGVVDSLPGVITITISSVNDAPVANAQTIATKKDQARSFTLSASDPDGDTLTYSLVEMPSHGTLTGAAPDLTYTPAGGYLGGDRFTFKVNDGVLASAPATVNINVNSNNTAPSALPQSVATDEDQAVNITLTANDAEGNTLSYIITSPPAHGVLTGIAPALTYAPADNYNGSDHFTFQASDGSLSSDQANVSVTVRPVNDAPIAEEQSIRTKQAVSKSFVLTAADIDGDALTYTVTVSPAHGTLSGTAPNLTYAPETSYYGADSLKFTVSDGQAVSNEATVAIKITPPIVSRTYTTTADFAEGNLFNVSSTIPNQLQTSIDQSNFDFVWIPVFTKGTVVRLDTETGRVLGEYRLTPDGVGDPYASRTAIDSKGNCWIANERTNTVVMIANPNGADWIDKNHNGRLDTSLGQDDVRPWTNPSGVNTNGGVSAAEDELIVRYVKTTATNLRQISVDGQDNVWVGGVGLQNFDLIDHNTGAIIRTEASNGRGGNGGFIDFDNVLWSTGRFLRWQANSPLSSVPPTPWNIPDNSWGVAKDPSGNIWVTYDPSEVVYKYTADGHLIGAYPHGSTWSQGLAIDANGDVWIATSHCGYFVSHLKNDGTFVGAVPVAAHGPTGVAIDRKGYIWVSNTNGVVQRINPLGGEVGRDGVTPIGEVDITSSYLGGTIWAYSNFTGAALARAGQRGRWTITYDSEQDGANWGPVVWTAQICNDGALPVYAALSEDGVHYAAEQLLTPENSVPSGSGRFITIRVDFEPSESGGVSPILQDLTVGTAGYVPPPVAHGWTVTAGEDINANWPDPLVLHGAVCRSAYDPAVSSSVTWSVVSGPGQVSFSDIHAIQPTCQFTKDGTYVFRVTALAGNETQTDDLTVRLTPYNKAPWVDAGPNRSARTFGTAVPLDGTVRDDGLPENTPLQIQWRAKYGPGTVTFANASSPTTSAMFSLEGIYTLELFASDGQYSATSTVEVRVGALCSIETIDGLVSWWQANGTAADHVSGNEAFLEKGATYDNGMVGAAFKFDGTDDRATVFKSPSLDVAKTGNGSLTLEFWMKPDLHEGSNRFLAQWKNVATNSYGVHIYRFFSQVRVNLVDIFGGNHQIFTNADVAPIGQWTHVAVTYDGATGVARIYINGVQQTSASLGIFTPQTGYDLYFASDIDSNGGAPNPPYKGLLDEISLYRRALDGNELHDIFAAGADGKCPIDENHPPEVNAGPDQSIARVEDVVALHGSVTDDGLPVDSGVALRWVKLSGPGNVTFGSVNSISTLATFSATGVYVLQLIADDGLDEISDTVTVRVGTFCRVEGPAGLTAWWPGNGDAQDMISGAVGRLLNGASFVEGKVSLGFQFDGANDAVRIPAASNLDVAKLGDGSMSLEFWMRPEIHAGDNRFLAEWRNAATGVTGVHVYRFFSQVRVNFVDIAGGNHQIFTNADVALINQWTHVGVTYDGKSGVARIYVNGVQHTSAPLGIFTPQTSYDLYFGSDLNSAGAVNPFYKGQLDEISLYSRSLDGQEMWDIFAADKEGKCPTDQNRAPVVSAGPNQSLARAGSTLTLSGTVTDDGLPLPASLTLQWRKLSGPGDVVLETPNLAHTAATFTDPGIYVMELSANDTLDHASDTVEVRVNAFCTVDSPPDLAAWWPGNGDALDVISGKVGRLLNGISFAEGKTSLGFKFDGDNDVVRIAADDSVNAAKNGSLTVEFWMNPEIHAGDNRMLTVWKNAVSGAYGVHIYRFFSQVRVNLIDTFGGNHQIFTNVDVAPINVWTHVAVTYDKPTGIARIYINGNQQTSANLGVFTPQTNYDLYFGNDASSGAPSNPFYKGMLDEISLYRRALDGKEIFDIYTADSDGKCPIDDNAAPLVNAGPDQSLTQTSGSVTLQGSVVDDGLPAGSAVGVEWSKVSGPGTVTFANQNAAITTATFSAPGIYVLQLIADDSLDQGSDIVEVRVGTYCRVEGPAGLTAWWPGNGDAKDVVSGAVGRLLNGASFVEGKVSMGFQFDGANDTVRIPAASNLDVAKLGDGSLSLEFWMRPEIHAGDNRFLVQWKNAASGVNGVHIYRFFSQVRVNFIDTFGGNHQIFTNVDVALVNQWTHVGVTYDKATGIARIYINGFQQTSAGLGSFTPQTSYDMYFGSDLNSAGAVNPFYKGQLDEISLYSRALDGQEMWDIFAADKDGKCPADQNRAPVVNAGPDQAVSQLNSPITLHGTVSDDGLPLPTNINGHWSKVSGPGQVSFGNADALDTTAAFDAAGIYVLRLTADDSLDSASDLMEVRVGAPCATASAESLVAWWPGNGDAQDVVTGQVGRLLNGASFVDAKVSMGFQFDGVNDTVRMPAAPNLDVAKSGNGSLTLEFWMKPDVHEGNNRFVAQWKNAASGVNGVHVYRFFSQVRVNLIDTAGANHQIFTNADVAFVNQWTHVAVTYDKPTGIARIYINGLQQTTATLGSFTPQTGYDFYLGSDLNSSGAPNPFYKGQLDEVSLYNTALTAAQIQAVSAAGACGKTPFVRNAPPVVNAGFDRTITFPTNSVTLAGTALDDGNPAGSTLSVSWTQTSGPVAAFLSSPETVQTTASFTQVGDYTFQLTANDGALTASSSVHVTVLPDLRTPPTVSLTAPAEGSRFQSNQTITISANAADNDGRVTKVEFFAGNVKLGEKLTAPYSFGWTNAPGGAQTLTATATDNDGLTATSAPIHIEVVDPNTAPPPKVELSSPEDASVVTAPTEVRGSVEMASLKSWRLEYQLQGTPCTEWITFAAGTGQVHDNVLGTLDPTMLLNGTYSVRLVVTDLANVSQTPNYLTFFIDGNMKVGQFSATFKDLELPLSGVPITVTRTYDSRNKCPGDFGYGWTLDVDSIRLESTEQMGDAWSQFIHVGSPFDPSYYRLDDVGPHLLSVKLPDGKLLRFTPKLIMDRPYDRLASLLDQDGDDIGQVYAPIQDDQPIKMIYRARPGTEGAVLKARGYRTTDTFGGSGIASGDSQFYLADTFEGAISLATRPGEFGEAPAMVGVTGWELTLRDGRVLLFDVDGKLEEMRDRVGNKVVFSRNGSGKIERITHTPSGKEIVFARDGANRIQSITDPAGNKVQYRYTTNGDLDAFFERGNDPANNTLTTRFTYKGLTHLLENILDARGIQAAKNYYDDAGRLIKTVDADGKETILTHDVNTRTETIKDRAGNITIHRYDERGNIIETHSPDGTVTATDYHRWSDGALSDLKETESVTGLFTDATTPTAPLTTRTLTTHYFYEDDDAGTPPANDGLLRKIVDPLGHTTTLTYDERGNVLTVSDANANAAGGTPAASVVNTYYANGLLQTSTDALGRTTIYTYDAKGNPDTETRTVTLTNPDGSSSQVSVVSDRDYNALGQLEKVTDPAGHGTTYEYDVNGNRRFERTTRTSGNATVAVVSETEYDAQDRPARTWNADNPRAQAVRPSSQTVYDDNGKVAWTYDALGRGTHQEYDVRGLLFKTTHPSNTFETVTYDAEGRREISTDSRGMATKTVYDAMGRVQQTIFLGNGSDPVVTLSTTAYDAAGRVWQSTDANGNTTSYGYDAAGRRAAVTQPLLQGSSIPFTTRYNYDENGNLRFVIDAKGRPTEHVYDALNRRIRTILPAAPIDLNGDGLLGSNEQTVITSTQTDYDELGRRVSETDASNRTKRYGYDVLGRLRHVIDYAGQATRFEYDEMGNQLRQTDANNHTTSYTYDSAGRRLTRTLPLGQQELLGYDDAGNLASRKDFNGRVTTFGYDAMNRLRYRVPDSSLSEPTIEFTYNANGQRETMRDATGTTVYGYDGRGQLNAKQTPFGTLSYGYYPNGSLKQMWSSNANGVNVSYGYDTLNRLATVTDANLGNTNYTYDEVGNLKSVAYPNNIKHQYTYNALNRLDLLIDRSPTNTIINCWRYHTTGAGQRTWVEEFDHRTAWYTYDNLGRLKTETVTGSIQDGKNGTVTYGYDNVGNRLTRSSSLSGVTNQALGYDANDRLNGDTYDNNGNTKVGTTSQPLNPSTPQQILGTDDYDGENRLTQRTGTNGSIVRLVYDGDGNRICEIVDGQIKSYLIDDRNPTGYAQVVEEIVNGAVNHTYTYGHDLISQDQVDPVTNTWHASFYAYDGRGNVRFLTNESGQVTDTYVYDAFGTLITATGSTNNRYLYAGEQFDPNLGLYYLRARLMNPLTGRFWIMDSYEGDGSEPISLHKYLYANADGPNMADPSGAFSQAFGYAVEREVKPIYLGDHEGLVEGKDVFFGKWARTGAGFRLKPDIFNTKATTWLEIKPLSPSGILRAATSRALYEAAFGFVGYSVDPWQPSRKVIYPNNTATVIFNDGDGTLFYTDLTDNAEDVAIVLATKGLWELLQGLERVTIRSATNETVYARFLSGVSQKATEARFKTQTSAIGVSASLRVF